MIRLQVIWLMLGILLGACAPQLDDHAIEKRAAKRKALAQKAHENTAVETVKEETIGEGNEKRSTAQTLPPETEPATDPVEIDGSFLTGVEIQFSLPEGKDPKSLNGITVTVEGRPDLVASTDASGYLQWELPPGEYDFAAVTLDRTYGARIEAVSIAQDSLTWVDAPLTPTGAIGGTVTLFVEGQVGLAGTEVFVPGTIYVAKTNSQGFFSLSGLPAGSYELMVTRDGFEPQTLSAIVVAEGETTELPKITLSVNRGPEGSFTILSNETAVVDGETLPLVTEPMVDLGITVDGEAVRVRLGNKAEFMETPWSEVTAQMQLPLPGDGVYTIYIQFADRDGVESNIYSKKVVVDASSPGIDRFVVAKGITVTGQRQIELELDYKDSIAVPVTTILLAEAPDFSDPLTKPVGTPTLSFELSEGAGQKTVYAKLMDGKGRESPPVSLEITVDATANDGGTWSPSAAVIPEQSSRPVVTHNDKAGFGMVMFTRPDDQGVDHFWVARQEAGSLRAPVQLDQSQNFLGASALAMNDSGVVVATWIQGRTSERGALYGSSYNPQTESWTTPERLDSAGSTDVWNFDLKAGPDGKFHVAFETWDGSEGATIYYLNYNGTSWSTQLAMESRGGYATEPHLTVDPAGNIVVTWAEEDDYTALYWHTWAYEIYARRFDAILGVWDTQPTRISQALDGESGQGRQNGKAMAVDRAGKVYVAYCHEDYWLETSEPYVVSLTKDGWSKPIRLDSKKQLTSGAYMDCRPNSIKLAVDSNNDLHAAWMNYSEGKIFLQRLVVGLWEDAQMVGQGLENPRHLHLTTIGALTGLVSFEARVSGASKVMASSFNLLGIRPARVLESQVLSSSQVFAPVAQAEASALHVYWQHFGEDGGSSQIHRASYGWAQ